MATTWQVTGDTPGQYDFDGAGNPVVGHTVAFVTGEGHTGSVFIPDTHYNATYVRAQIQAKARIVDEVNTLTSGQ